MYKKWFWYDPATGLFSGVGFSGSEEFLNLNIPIGLAAFEVSGIFDPLSKKVNLQTLELEDYQPPAPNDTDLHTWVWDTDIKRWKQSPTFLAKQLEKWRDIKTLRSSIEFGGFSWDGSMFDSDEISQSRIQGAVILAMQAISANQPFEITWTLADNTTRVLSATDMVAVGQNLSIHVATQHEIARSLRSAINATITDEELNAITWPASTSGSAAGSATITGES